MDEAQLLFHVKQTLNRDGGQADIWTDLQALMKSENPIIKQEANKLWNEAALKTWEGLEEHLKKLVIDDVIIDL